MDQNLHLFISSLLTDRFVEANPEIPDGTCDNSAVANLVATATRCGRAVYSMESYSYASFLGRVLSELFSPNQSDESRDEGIMALALLLAFILDKATEMCGDSNAEEIIMAAVGPDEIRQLKSDLSALPYVVGKDGQLCPNFASLSVFAKSRSITRRQRDGFARRHYVPTLPFLFEADTDIEDESSDNVREHVVRFVNISDHENLEVDRFDGFDDFYDYFLENQYRRYEEGESLEVLMNEEFTEDENDD